MIMFSIKPGRANKRYFRCFEDNRKGFSVKFLCVFFNLLILVPDEGFRLHFNNLTLKFGDDKMVAIFRRE